MEVEAPRIVQVGDPVLRAATTAVDPAAIGTPEIQDLIWGMVAAMHRAPGVGLAAPQVGALQRVVVMDLAKEGTPPDPIVMINPEILKFSDETVVTEEGCLSIPDLYYEVERPAAVTVKYTNLEGETITRDAEDRLAICVQHELDHLDGVLYIDYLSRLKRDRVLKKFEKAEKLAKRAS